VSAVGRIVANHMRPGQLAREGQVTGRAVYRFFRATGGEGVGICLLALADLCGQTQAQPEPARWERRLAVAKRLLQAYFERRELEVEPQPLVNGEDLMGELGMEAGPELGDLLEAIRQSQADGAIQSREEALAFAAGWRPRIGNMEDV
jgi:hypothetical protein